MFRSTVCMFIIGLESGPWSILNSFSFFMRIPHPKLVSSPSRISFSFPNISAPNFGKSRLPMGNVSYIVFCVMLTQNPRLLAFPRQQSFFKSTSRPARTNIVMKIKGRLCSAQFKPKKCFTENGSCSNLARKVNYCSNFPANAKKCPKRKTVLLRVDFHCRVIFTCVPA